MTKIFVISNIVCIFDIQTKYMTQTNNSQKNTYVVYDSMGRRTDIYIIASNAKEAHTMSKTPEMKARINSAFYTIKRAYNGGIRGQQ